jgi:hypothetical protein
VKAAFNGTCGICKQFRPRCATVAVRGCNAWGDRDVRVMTLCEECRKECRNNYRLHPKHK